MERDKIIKALECCITDSCISCPYADVVGVYSLCGPTLLEDALALIKELTEENERLKDRVLKETHLRHQTEEMLANGMSVVRADTVRKMQERLDKRFCHDPAFLGVEQRLIMDVIDQIAKEMLEGNDDNT